MNKRDQYRLSLIVEDFLQTDLPYKMIAHRHGIKKQDINTLIRHAKKEYGVKTTDEVKDIFSTMYGVERKDWPIIEAIKKGLSKRITVREIASQVGKSTAYTQWHVSKVYRMLGVRNKKEAYKKLTA